MTSPDRRRASRDRRTPTGSVSWRALAALLLVASMMFLAGAQWAQQTGGSKSCPFEQPLR